MNQNNPTHPILAKEGWLYIGLSCIVMVLVATWSLLAAIPFALIFLFVLQFFRDPTRTAIAGPDDVLSPADGRIVAIQEADDPYANRKALKISVFMNVFNVHSNRMPLTGQIEQVQYFKGKFVNADLDKASLENERNALVIRTADQQTVTCVQVAGLIARRILCYAKVGQQLEAGQRYGFIRFGSRVDVYLPLSARPQVVIGDKVKATLTVLAKLSDIAEVDPIIESTVID